MAVTHKTECGIRVEQSKVLDSLICERVSDNAKENKRVLGVFVNKHTNLKEGVLGHLHGSGIEDDQSRETAVYIVKTKENVGLLAFSLKCSEMFAPMAQNFDSFLKLCVLFLPDLNPTERLWIKQHWSELFKPKGVVKRLRRWLMKMKWIRCLGRKGCSSQNESQDGNCKDFARDIVNELLSKWRQKVDDVREDIESGKNRHVTRVSKTRSGVQLVDFCKNENAEATAVWKKIEAALGLRADCYSVGQVLFWKFVAPRVFKVREIVGCDCMFLFAADRTDDERLVAYYKEALNFQVVQDYGANKPLYDLRCKHMMCQSVDEMREAHKKFFGNFNYQDEDMEM